MSFFSLLVSYIFVCACVYECSVNVTKRRLCASEKKKTLPEINYRDIILQFSVHCSKYYTEAEWRTLFELCALYI